MSFIDGMAALNLEMPDRVPRTEYSVEMHLDLINRVLGLNLSPDAPIELWTKARRDFMQAWNYGFVWSTDIYSNEFGEIHTSMGHANYAAGAGFNNHTYSYFHSVEEVLRFDAVEMLPHHSHRELVDRFNQSYADRCTKADAVNTVGTYVTAVSALIDLFGWDYLLNALGEDPEQFGKVLERYSVWLQRYFDAMADCNAPVIMIHDDITWTSGPFASPQWYRDYVFPCYKRYIAPLKEAGKKVIFTSDGTYTAFIDDIAACNVDGFVLEPTTDMAYIAEKYGKTHSFIGNADTRILLMGSKEDIENEVKRCMDIGKKCPGFIMAVGNHIPPNTPIDNALWYNECYEKMSRR